MTAEQQC